LGLSRKGKVTTLIDRAAIVGHSLGAAVAAELARHRPDRVTRLVLLAPTGLPRPPLWLRTAGRALLYPAILGALLPPLWRKVLDLAFAERNEYTCGFTACIEETCRPEDLADIAAVIAGLRDGFLDGTLAGTFDDVEVPTLLAWGANDPLAPGAALRIAAARRPDVVAHEIPRCGRMPMIERPQETFALIRRHLRPLFEMSPVEADLTLGPAGVALRPVVVSSAAEARKPPADVAPVAEHANGRSMASAAPERKPARREQGLRRELL
jgi:pimeloyl-ACP methyl ester carboxylesterase